MGLTVFDQLPDHARLWAFASDTILNEQEQEIISTGVAEFLKGWAAHGVDLKSGLNLVHGKFLLVGVDQDQEAPSGCSIDAMTRFLKQVREQTGIDFLDTPHCCFRDGDTIRSVDRKTFRHLAEEGKVDNETIVFDLTIPTVGDVRAGKFETAADNTWYAKAFPLGQIA